VPHSSGTSVYGREPLGEKEGPCLTMATKKSVYPRLIKTRFFSYRVLKIGDLVMLWRKKTQLFQDIKDIEK
jgi:hypothetical protein